MIVILEEKRRSAPVSVCVSGVGVALIMMLAMLNVVYYTTTKCQKFIDNLYYV